MADRVIYWGSFTLLKPLCVVLILILALDDGLPCQAADRFDPCLPNVLRTLLTRHEANTSAFNWPVEMSRDDAPRLTRDSNRLIHEARGWRFPPRAVYVEAEPGAGKGGLISALAQYWRSERRGPVIPIDVDWRRSELFGRIRGTVPEQRGSELLAYVVETVLQDRALTDAARGSLQNWRNQMSSLVASGDVSGGVRWINNILRQQSQGPCLVILDEVHWMQMQDPAVLGILRDRATYSFSALPADRIEPFATAFESAVGSAVQRFIMRGENRRSLRKYLREITQGRRSITFTDSAIDAIIEATDGHIGRINGVLLAIDPKRTVIDRREIFEAALDARPSGRSIGSDGSLRAMSASQIPSANGGPILTDWRLFELPLRRSEGELPTMESFRAIFREGAERLQPRAVECSDEAIDRLYQLHVTQDRKNMNILLIKRVVQYLPNDRIRIDLGDMERAIFAFLRARSRQ